MIKFKIWMEFKMVLVLYLYHLKIVNPAIQFLKTQNQIILLKLFISSIFLKHKEWVVFQNQKLEPNHLRISHQNMIHLHGMNFMIKKKC